MGDFHASESRMVYDATTPPVKTSRGGYTRTEYSVETVEVVEVRTLQDTYGSPVITGRNNMVAATPTKNDAARAERAADRLAKLRAKKGDEAQKTDVDRRGAQSQHRAPRELYAN